MDYKIFDMNYMNNHDITYVPWNMYIIALCLVALSHCTHVRQSYFPAVWADKWLPSFGNEARNARLKSNCSV